MPDRTNTFVTLSRRSYLKTHKSERERTVYSCSTYCTSSRPAQQIFAISAGKRAFPVAMTVAVAKAVPRLSPRSASSVYQPMGNVT